MTHTRTWFARALLTGIIALTPTGAYAALPIAWKYPDYDPGEGGYGALLNPTASSSALSPSAPSGPSGTDPAAGQGSGYNGRPVAGTSATGTPPTSKKGSLLDCPIERPIRGLAIGKAPAPKPEEADSPTDHDDDPPDEEPPTIYGEELPEGDSIIYVADESGSMNRKSDPYIGLDGNTVSGGRKIDKLIVELKRSIAALPESFEFNIITYDCSTNMWEQKLQKATPANKLRSFGFVDAIWAGGGTGTGPATVLGLFQAPDLIALITDGSPNCGADGMEGHARMIKQGNYGGTSIHTFGIDAGSGQRAFLQQVAFENNGKYTDVN